MADAEPIVAVGLLTERDLAVLGQAFRRFYPVEDHSGFEDLLRRIDEAERVRAEAAVVRGRDLLR